MNTDQLAAWIAANNKGEQEAIEGYFRLIDDARRADVPGDFIADIHEIISDEMNHSQKLSAWVTRLTGIKPAKD